MDATEQHAPNQRANDAESTPRYGTVDQETGKRICAALGTTALAVYWALACHRPTIKPGSKSVAGVLKISRDQVKRCIRELEQKGFLRRVLRPGKPTIYELTQCTHAPTPDLSRCTDALPPGAPMHLPVGAPMHPEDKKDKTRRENKNTYTLAAFAEWYAAYPRHEARAAAAKAFSAALARLTKRHDSDEQKALVWLMEKTRAFAAAKAGTDKQYIAHPASWLNGERYDDDPAAWNAANERTANGRPARPTTYGRFDPSHSAG